MAANRGKKSITIDIAKPAGPGARARARAGAPTCCSRTTRSATSPRYGLGYEDLKAINPRLIYCSITGFGQTGPYRETPGYDFMVQGMGGFMSVTGERDDQPGGGPQRVGVPIVDIMTGHVLRRSPSAPRSPIASATGIGQFIDMALLDTQVAILANQGMNFLATGEPPGRLGNTHPNIVPYQSFKTKDGDIILACGNDNLFNKFCEVADAAHLLEGSALRHQRRARRPTATRSTRC